MNTGHQSEACPEHPSPPDAKEVLRRPGFTLIELITVVIIVGIMSAIVAPRFFTSLSFHRAEAAARRIQMDLELARRQARTTSASHTVQFLPKNDSYSLKGVADLDHAASTYTVDLSVAPYQVSIVSADFGGDALLVFDGYGAADSAGQVVIQAGKYQRTISVDPVTGKATIQ